MSILPHEMIILADVSEESESGSEYDSDREQRNRARAQRQHHERCKFYICMGNIERAQNCLDNFPYLRKSVALRECAKQTNSPRMMQLFSRCKKNIKKCK